MVERNDCPEFCKLYRAEHSLEQLEKFVLTTGTVPTLADLEVDNPHFI